MPLQEQFVQSLVRLANPLVEEGESLDHAVIPSLVPDLLEELALWWAGH